MHDMHSHILPGVDDGSPNLETSLKMLEAAKAAGVTAITCTPHCRSPYFDFEAMWRAFYQLEDACDGFPLRMGFEVNYKTFMQLGMDWHRVLHFDNSPLFLLELSTTASPSRFADYERTIFELQGMGYEIIIAHPERYLAVQQDLGVAYELVAMGCKLQASADFIAGGRFRRERKPALRMLKAGLYSYLASDAHTVEHYRLFGKCWNKYAELLH